MKHAFRSWILNLLAVVAALLLATLMRWVLDPWLVGGWRPIVTMYGAVAFVAWFSGWRWATMTTIAGYLVVVAIFKGPPAASAVGTLGGLSGYVFSCSVIIAVGQAARRAHARAVGAAGVIQEQALARDTERRRLDVEREQADRRLAIQYAVTRILAEVDSPDVAVPLVLGAAGEALGWSVGALWAVDQSQSVLCCSALWSDPAKSAPEFTAVTRQTTFAQDVGLPGRVWASGQPAWIEDVVKDPNFPRAPQARADGLHGAFAFPIIVSGNVVAILEFFNDSILVPDEDLLQQVTGISRQLGQYIHRKNAEHTLRESEQRFRHVVNTVPAAVWTADASGAMTWASDRWFASAGPTPDGLAGDWARVLHPDDQQQHHEQWATAVRDGREFQIEVRFRRQDGQWRWWLTQATPVKDAQGRVVSWFGSSTDIHDQRVAQDALRDSEERFAAFMRHLPGAAWMKDLQGRYIYANREAERIFSASMEELAGHTDQEVFPRDVAEQFSANDRRAIHAGSAQIIESLQQADGVHQSIVSKFVVCGASGEPEAVGGVAFDVTERLRAEHALRESEERLRLALRAGRAGVWDWDIDDNRVTWSDYLYDLHGVAREAFPGTIEGFAKMVHPDDLPMVKERLEAALESNEPYELEYRILRPDGQMRWNYTSAAVLRDNGRPIRMYGVCTDVTERKQVEAELGRHREHLQQLVVERTAALEQTHLRLRQSERMAAVGTLAAGIGHDLGNLLLPIRGHLDVLRRLSLVSGGRENIAAIASCVDYLQNLYRGLRQFAQDPEQASSETSDLDAWRLQVESFFRSAVPSHVAFDWRLPTNLPRLAIAPHALTQAVYNLVLNAADVLRGRSHGRVELGAEAADAQGRIRLIVADNGPGMSDEVRRHCLEPFFTTKPRGHSTGLGLSLVHSVVQRAGGSIDIESSPGAGTRFVLTLPVSVIDPERAQKPEVPWMDAALSVHDQRLAAVITSLLPPARVRAVPIDAPDDSNPMIWVTDRSENVENLTREFLGRGPRHQCLLLEHEPGAMQVFAAERIIVVPARSGITLFQSAIRRCIAGVRRSGAAAESNAEPSPGEAVAVR